MLRDVDQLEALGRGASWVAAILGVLAGMAWLVAVLANNRAARLKEELKRAPPQLDVSLGFFRDSTLHVVIDARGRIPFECQWKIVTRDNVIVSGIPLNWAKVHPTRNPQRFNESADIEAGKIRDNFLELRFDFRSLWADEIALPELRGRIVKPYRVDLARKILEPA